MELIKSNNMITQAELSSKIGISPKNIRNNIAFLKQNGLIVRVGTRKNGHWEVITLKNE
jgi:predicted HTH transcriptional regulator